MITLLEKTEKTQLKKKVPFSVLASLSLGIWLSPLCNFRIVSRNKIELFDTFTYVHGNVPLPSHLTQQTLIQGFAKGIILHEFAFLWVLVKWAAGLPTIQGNLTFFMERYSVCFWLWELGGQFIEDQGVFHKNHHSLSCLSNTYTFYLSLGSGNLGIYIQTCVHRQIYLLGSALFSCS